MSRPSTFFRTLDGVTVHYDRTAAAPYGSRGIPYDFYATRELETKLDGCFAELWRICPLGRPEIIISAGAYVGKPGYHGSGEAFDLDGIHWANKSFICLNFPSDRHFYLGVDAILRKHFNTVLNFYFNRDHEDHLHVEFGGQAGFNRVRNKIFFLQAALTHVLEIPVAIDGAWGDETADGTARALSRLGIGGQIEDAPVWTRFLTAVAQRAFSGITPQREKTASELLRDVYSVITHELAGNPVRKKIETALTTFVSNEDVKKVLDLADDTPLDNPPVEATAKKVRVRKEKVGSVTKWYAIVDEEPEFLVGKETAFPRQGGNGLSLYAGVKYIPDDYRREYDFWADFIYPTAFCESEAGYFNALNTWDRAHFTFGFLQFAAHTYDGDFAKYFRALLGLPEAAAYFPDLKVKENRIHQKVGDEWVNLELNQEPTSLAKYLNPDFKVVEQIEAEQAARFIHWCEKSPANRNLQVKISVQVIREILSGRARTYALDGKPDKVCLVIADLHHQGRGGNQTVSLIKNALDTGGDMDKAYKNLLEIGKADYAPRIRTLRTKVAALERDGKLGIMKYNAAQKDFVPLS